jgi:late competence protein required for DNA uptake (superfamily II DNA/RNA helicase)
MNGDKKINKAKLLHKIYKYLAKKKKTARLQLDIVCVFNSIPRCTTYQYCLQKAENQLFIETPPHNSLGCKQALLAA